MLVITRGYCLTTLLTQISFHVSQKPVKIYVSAKSGTWAPVHAIPEPSTSPAESKAIDVFHQ
jgi:hypothetical protein